MSEPRILIVDDEPDLQESSISLEIDPAEATVLVRHPRDVTSNDIRTAHAIAIDHYLEEWFERDDLPVAARPTNGFAVAAVLRAQLQDLTPGPAIALRTGKLQKLAGPLPLRSAEHLLAWQHDVEWVFPKADIASNPSTGTRLMQMAAAVQSLRDCWSSRMDQESLVFSWLGAPDVIWRPVAFENVEQSRPPVNEVGDQTNGASVLRWFLHRVLPYPTFLLDTNHVAVRLGVRPEWLEDELKSDSSLADALSECRYTGAFGEFLGRRWWRPGLANAAARLTDSHPFDREALAQAITERSSSAPEFLPLKQHVVGLDPETLEASKIYAVEDSVRVAPDGWPAHAEDVWAKKSDVADDPVLAAMAMDPYL